ncbi:MAG: cell wall-binding repeat-containing protein [Bacillota bacterium]|nr:cell wall-binding repeat-containing protein [Bacillota bacterium]
MKKFFLILFCITVLILSSCMTQPNQSKQQNSIKKKPPKVTTNIKITRSAPLRITGNSPFDVAVNIAKNGWHGHCKIIYIVNYGAYANALVTVPIAYKNHAPILLVQTNQVPRATEDEIKSLHPSKVILIGDEKSISRNVADTIGSLGIKINRLSGKNQFEIADMVANQLMKSKTAIITNSSKIVEALSIAPYAAKNEIPILLTDSNNLPPDTTKILKHKERILVIGGPNSINSKIFSQLPGKKLRINGKNEFEVGKNIIKKFNMNIFHIFIASNISPSDGITGSVLAAKQHAALLLTASNVVPLETKEILREGKTGNFTVLGNQISIADDVEKNLFPIINTHTIEGYSDQISYFPGQTIQLKVHAPNLTFSINMIRYGKEEKILKNISTISGQPQNYFPDSYKEGAEWDTTYQFKIPDNWQSGLYAARLFDHANQFFVTFVIKNKQPLKKDIAVLSSTDTWQAYNDWGGKSLYTYQVMNGKSIFQNVVSFERPNPKADPNGDVGHLANGEKHILSWLESMGYHYDLMADHDLNDNPHLLDPYKVLIISTHSEYWTPQMYSNLQNYLHHGGTLLYLAGNGIYWRANLEDGKIEVNKNSGYKSLLKLKWKGGRFGATSHPESSVLGVRYRSTGFAIPAPYRVINPSHWIFAHTNVKRGDLIGVKGLNAVSKSIGGASGWETDQMDKNSPKNTILLAKGTNTFGKGADMVYYDTPEGGGVFSVGSITFGGSLIIDPKLSIMVENIIQRFNK